MATVKNSILKVNDNYLTLDTKNLTKWKTFSNYCYTIFEKKKKLNTTTNLEKDGKTFPPTFFAASQVCLH